MTFDPRIKMMKPHEPSAEEKAEFELERDKAATAHADRFFTWLRKAQDPKVWDSIAKEVAALGGNFAHTGGGCTAFAMTSPTGQELLIADNDSGIDFLGSLAVGFSIGVSHMEDPQDGWCERSFNMDFDTHHSN